MCICYIRVSLVANLFQQRSRPGFVSETAVIIVSLNTIFKQWKPMWLIYDYMVIYAAIAPVPVICVIKSMV